MISTSSAVRMSACRFQAGPGPDPDSHCSFNFNSSFGPTTTRSSDEVCTLFPHNPVTLAHPLSPIGVFWDIENCQVPSGKSALVAVQRIRERFFNGYLEAEFVCVCDIRKESVQVIQELNDAQVSVVHVSGNSKNAADDKLRQAMRRYADTHASIGTSGKVTPATRPAVLLISGDVNFATDLSDLRYRKRVYVILLHNKHAPDALVLCAHQHYDFHSVLENLPNRPSNLRKELFEKSKGIPLKGGHSPMDVVVTDLPQIRNLTKLKNRLRKLSDNCGGKVVTIQGQFAVLRFPNKEAALRASKRMNGEDVFGSKIRVIYSSQMEFANAQGQIKVNPSQPRLPLQQSVSVASIPLSGISSHSRHAVWKPTWSLQPSGSMTEFDLTPKPSEPIVPLPLPQSGSSHSSSGSISGDSSREPSPASAPANANASAGTLVSKVESFDLHVSNIDPNIGDWKVVRQALVSAFAEHVTVRGVWVYMGQDGGVSAVVRVNTKEDGHYAVSHLHRRKIGNKRIFISFDTGLVVDHPTLKKEVAALLQDVPNYVLPLFKFREMFEKRYRRSVSSSDLYRMKDVVIISDSSASTSSSSGSSLFPTNGRRIALSAEWKNKLEDGLGVYCAMHPPMQNGSGKTRLGWAEKEVGITLPSVMIDFKVLSQRIHALVESHNGGLPLFSFLDCYEADFEPMERLEDGSGVQLEHLISCVPGVEIAFGENGMKRIQWSEKRDFDTGLTQPLATQMAQLARELMDLLKTFPRCSLPFSKLIPAYHHHFGRQCRVADYGHTSLSTLLQTLPLTIQVTGEGQNRVITLAHRAQMKRFATDVLRVLKAQPGVKKQVRVDEFASAFAQLFPTRTFLPEDYGLCYFSDLIAELTENSALVTMGTDDDGTAVLCIPKREQSPQELHRTRVFSNEVIELLGHSIRCEMPFSKFIPAYHHHFGRQCRVSDYGFSKLAELFDAIGDSVVSVNPVGIPDCNPEDKIIRLSPSEQVKIVGEQIWNLVDGRTKNGQVTRLSDLEEIFLIEQGFALRPDFCGAVDLEDLVDSRLASYVRLEGDRIGLVDRLDIDQLVADTKNMRLEKQASGAHYRLGTKAASNHHVPNGTNGRGLHSRTNGSHEQVKKRWSSAHSHHGRSGVGAPQPPPLYSPTMTSSPNYRTRTGDTSNVFSFEQPTPLSPPVYDMWMADNIQPSSPPVSPPLVWAYHPICYPSPNSPGTPTNVLMPNFSYGQWSPPPTQTMMASACFEHVQQQK